MEGSKINNKVPRLQIVASARAWIGTPYRHQASKIYVACDCLGLIRGLWREFYGFEPDWTPNYAADWADASGGDQMLETANSMCCEVPMSKPIQAAEILLFRWRDHLPAKHIAVASGDNTFIHAYERGSVMETTLIPAWQRRICARFDFPRVMNSGVNN